ncbi:MAG: glycerophosphoryl diester phosphodiesterase membrane domain-containing protein [Candidatus Aenigmatarchaeota archaeon]
MLSDLNLFWLSNLFYLISAMVACLVFSLVLSVIVIGAFPLAVYQSLKKKEIKLTETLKSSLKKFGKVLLTLILLASIFIGIISIPFSFLILSIFLNLQYLFLIFIILLIPFLILFIFFSLRLSLAIPILMLENKSSLESIKESWKKTKGRVWSILGGSLLLTLVMIIISLPINLLAIIVEEILQTPYTSTLTNIITSTINLAVSTPFATIVYLNIKKKL